MHADAVRERRRRIRLARLRSGSFAVGFAALTAFALGPNAASAEESPSRVRAAVMDPSDTPYPVSPGLRRMQLEFHGGSETDVGYAAFDPGQNFLKEKFYDFRGRFVLGADLDYGFANNFYFHGRGQLVNWIRETLPQYQVNVDDAFIQVGQRQVWDFLIGRFMTWKVYRKGLGFDIYTLEDTGALERAQVSQSITASPYGPHVYGVDNIWLRGTQGRAGLHLYPTSWSGLEVVGEYGRNLTQNSIGGRAAGKIEYGPASLALGLELKHAQPAIDNPACDTCGVNNLTGYGGGLVLDFRFVELGGNVGIAKNAIYGLTDGSRDSSSSGKATSLGGYLELDPGLLLMNRSLIIGAGLNQTDVEIDAGDKKKHVQGAAYIAYPLGFNDAMIKLVLSKADLTVNPRNNVEEYNSHMVAARVRVAFNF
jgi:hypothetical protein